MRPCTRWAWTLRSWRSWKRMPAWVTVVWVALPPVSSIRWPRSECRPMATVFATSTVFSRKRSATGSRLRNRTIGSVTVTRGRRLAPST
uniref:Putative secreted peptide n=1 Tax=Anopheles braziliensis TaxID=58242 RepID=A0A2M3ZMI4_9DIPT